MSLREEENKFVSIALVDLLSLITLYESASDEPNQFMHPLFVLYNHKRALESENPPQFIQTDILTLNSQWEDDGLFMLLLVS